MIEEQAIMATIFPPDGGVLKRNGMAKAAKGGSENLRFARQIALELGEKNKTMNISADDVRQVFEVRHPDLAWGSHWPGSIFKDGKWEFVSYSESTTPSRHRGVVRVWSLKSRQRGD